MIRALNTIALVVAVVLAFALYKAKTEAHAARERLDALTVMVEEERRAAAVLRAEIAFLERPERLRALAARHLGLEPTDPDREVDMEQALLALGLPDPDAPSRAYVQGLEPESAPQSAPASADLPPAPPPSRVAEAAPVSEPARVVEAAPLPPTADLRGSEDPIAALILNAGGLN